MAYSIWKSDRPRRVILQRRRSAFQTQMRIFKFNLSANERVERKEDVDPSHLNPLADADADLDVDVETASIPDDDVRGASASNFSEAIATRAAGGQGETVRVRSCAEAGALICLLIDVRGDVGEGS